MATYAIGDIQGCFVELQALLALIQFDPKKDTLWFTGDLINRGPESLEVLRFVKSLPPHHKIVLGNHDLNLIAVHYGVRELRPGDTLQPILQASDREALIAWFCSLPLFYRDPTLSFTIVHAGLAPAWSLDKAAHLAREVEEALQRDPQEFVQYMYGDEPALWQDNLTGKERLRCITNYFTRMRFCYPDGRLELKSKGNINHKPPGVMPWFKVPKRANARDKIIFGHWAALNGETDVPFIYPLDTGCVWGNMLTAMRLEDEKHFSVKAARDVLKF
jgi:bis(5'-nucleosyl)-tetraphosphatase (symmetrical)